MSDLDRRGARQECPLELRRDSRHSTLCRLIRDVTSVSLQSGTEPRIPMLTLFDPRYLGVPDDV
jgi:hypothetical protein